MTLRQRTCCCPWKFPASRKCTAMFRCESVGSKPFSACFLLHTKRKQNKNNKTTITDRKAKQRSKWWNSGFTHSWVRCGKSQYGNMWGPDPNDCQTFALPTFAFSLVAITQNSKTELFGNTFRKSHVGLSRKFARMTQLELHITSYPVCGVIFLGDF